jgi:hypothetical protein
MDGRTDGRVDGTDGRTGGWVDRWVGEWVCEWVGVSGYKKKQTNSVALSPRANYTD